MEKWQFSIREALRFGWQEFKKQWVLWVGVAILMDFLPLVPYLLRLALPEDALFAWFSLSIFYYVLTLIASMGLYTLALKAARQEEYRFSDVFSKVHYFPSYLWGYILFSVLVVLGLFLLFIPGIIFFLMFSLWPFFVLDRATTGWESLTLSKEAVYGYKWKILLFFLATLLLNILGFLLLIVGLFVTVPVTMMAWAYIYLRLTEQTLTIGDEA